MNARWEFKLRALASKLYGLLSRRHQRDSDFDVEVQQHLLLLVERYMAQGMSRQAAAEAARRQFGNTTLLQEDRRDLQRFSLIEEVWHDLRYSLRTLWKARGFAAVSIATLALGMGAATAIFSVIDNVLLAPFPYQGAPRMVFPRIHAAQQAPDEGRQGYTANEVLDFAENNHVFDGLTAAKEDLVLYRHGEGTEQLYGAHVTAGTFEFFGLPALHGRVAQPEDYAPGAPPVFVLRYKTWKERFNGDLSVLNRTFVLNGTARTLIGIMPPRFGWYDADVYIPEKLTRAAAPAAGFPDWFLLGRLQAGVSRQRAEADLTVIANHLAKIYPQAYPTHFTVQLRKLGDSVIGRFEETLYTVLAAVLAATHRLQQRCQSDAGTGHDAREGICAAHGAGRKTRKAGAAAHG
jgi:hypothetical protein